MAFNPQSVCPRQVPNNAPFLAHGGPMFGPYASSSGRQTLDAPRGHHGVESPTSERPAQSLTAISEGLRLAFFLPILCRVRSLTPSRLFNDPEYSDLEVRCGNRTWKVHRVIVCGRCEFFKACVDRNFKGKEAAESVIDLPDDDPDAIEILLKYLYTYDIATCLKDITNDRQGTDELAVIMFVTADKYYPELKSHWYRVLESTAKMSGWITQTSNFSAPTFKGDKVAEFLSLIYSWDAPGMENIRKQAVAALFNTGFFRGLLLKDEAMISVFQEHEDLRKAFLTALLQRDQTQKPLLAMLNHDSVYSSVVKDPKICMELIQNLIEPSKIQTGGVHTQFVNF